MVLIKVYGLDQFVVANFSKEHTSNIAKLLEISEEEIMFYAPNSYIFFKGVEQTSWNATIEVNLEEKFHPLEENLKNYLFKALKPFSINLHIFFIHYSKEHYFEEFNSEYPRFIKEENMVQVDDEHDEDIDVTNEEEVYTGNVFANLKKK